MDATLAIAIWGALTGTVATLGGLVSLLRDRPKLEASQQIDVVHAGKDSTARLVLHVVNNGRQPVSMFTAGFAMRTERQGPWPRRRLVPLSINAEAEGPDVPMRLAPGEAITITLDLIGPKRIYMPDCVPQGFAADTHQNVAWAKPHIDDDTLQGVYDELDWSGKAKRKPAAKRPPTSS